MTSIKSSLKEIDAEILYQTNPLAKFVENQRIVEVPELTLESGITIRNFPVAYKTWGRLNEARNNVLLICHAMTGSADVSDWWGPLLGTNLAFDPSRFLVVCLNCLGSPYGSFSPLSVSAVTGRRYGPEFPLCTVRDDVRAHKIVLDSLGVNSIACVVGGSMGGMLALEWAVMYSAGYVRSLVALATSARNSAWCISWSEAQRQSIYCDPKYLDGYYSLDDPPNVGLSAARMSALLTYRSRDSFETRFSRNSPTTVEQLKSSLPDKGNKPDFQEHNISIHNSGHQGFRFENRERVGSISSDGSVESIGLSSSSTSLTSLTPAVKRPKALQTHFSAQSYLRYQGAKFTKRFDANCYISITRKLDTHDLVRDRPQYNGIHDILNTIAQPVLVIGIKSDGLFTYSEQEFLSEHIPNSQLEQINSPDGHDAFLLEFRLINELIIKFLEKNIQDIMDTAGYPWEESVQYEAKESVFGASEVTNW
ncbi:homoserine O-acetyltransferase Ecym_1073 [Eremothecium cymbalariae DBVPG|uniref:AB hydrolase-1 domain-containing protein n=1 Tax=Eremothecium cymbalariae (strain CBS 270.75 / DBVPG 7215 / KCTC 17166 / NRRL Y-17582) TaxID=931890 RepID=G8JMC2_ERECY|nr:hypothetical protein Ecym_1073 [Eremothecium cymbalariae DBVPG\